MLFNRRTLIGSGLALSGVPLRALAGARPPFVNRIAIEDDRVWIAAKIGDKGPFFFIVDTGAQMSLIEDAFAKSMGFKKLPGRRQSKGVGGTSYNDWYDAGTVTLASGIRFPNMLFAGIAKRIAKDAVGAFGAGMFTTLDSDLDFAAGEWRAYPDGRPSFEGMTRLDARFTDWRGGQRIIANATVDNYQGDFLLDTGAPGELLLFGHASRKSGLWNDTQPYAPTYSYGIGRYGVPSRIVRAKTMKIGTFEFRNVLVRLSDPDTLAVDNDGIIGLGAMQRLHLSTQVSKKAVWAALNDVPVPPARYPLSGLWLDDKGGRVVIEDVGTGSPAALAGVKSGDVAIGVYADLLRATEGRPGKPIKLTVERGGVRKEFAYTLAPWL
jgi:predicted aspartyl protease